MSDDARRARVERKTNETAISLELCIDGEGEATVSTGIGFLDHMLELFAKHGAFDLTVQAEGDLHVDQHHTVEDVGICLGQAVRQALGDKAGIRRYGHFTLPMEEALVTTAVDLSGRYSLVFQADFPSEKIGEFDSELVEDFWQAAAANALMNFHAVQHHGRSGGLSPCISRDHPVGVATATAIESDAGKLHYGPIRAGVCHRWLIRTGDRVDRGDHARRTAVRQRVPVFRRHRESPLGIQVECTDPQKHGFAVSLFGWVLPPASPQLPTSLAILG